MTTAYSESTTEGIPERVPGRSWTVRLTGHSDRTATVTCSTAACRMPARSKNLAAMRTFAAQHAAAHAKAATIRPNASCHCRAQQCAAHPDMRVHCAGVVVMILRHDPTVGRVWSVEEVCAACAPLISHATVVARATRPRPAAAERDPAQVPAPRSAVPGGFSSPGAPADGAAQRRRPRPTARRPRRPGNGQGR
ncbi:hypothetical protein [Streptomyces sp. NPDC002133]|uniref:hypothetical protein n=1 Tax=Streptomyces sp. NPDC002133 TaxID=3154409 RepID=UPI00331A169D